MYEKIPEELKKYNNWVCWQAVPDPKQDDPGHVSKKPICALTSMPASSTDPSTWCDFQTAVEASERCSGIGFVFTNSPFFGVDLDGIRGDIDEFLSGIKENIVGKFIGALGSYAEISQSGNGLHIICRGTLPEGGRVNHKKGVEMYETGRYFTMTGNALTDSVIADCTEEIKPLHTEYIGGKNKKIPPKNPVKKPPENIPEILQKARTAKNGETFSALMDGNWENFYKSQSEADMALCNMLAFWLGRDPEAMDQAFRASGLYREKWDRKQSGSTYGALTIQKAISECGEVYGENYHADGYKITIGNSGEKLRIYSMDDTGNAARLFDNYGEKLKFCYIEKCWYWYDGTRWCRDVTGTVDRVADDSLKIMENELEVYREMDKKNESYDPVKDIGDCMKAFEKHKKNSRSSKAKTAMKNEFRQLVPIVPGRLDQYKLLFNTPNGIIDLTSGKLLPHDPELYLTKIAGTEYKPADCPLWKNFLNDIFQGDLELIRYVQKAVGYSLSGLTSEQCVFFLYGTGRNGKSTFLDVIHAMMGDYACNAQPDTIMFSPKNAGGARSDIARLKGARLVTTVEPNEGMRLDEGLIKQLTGGDPVTTRFQYASDFEFTPEFKIWMATNHKPIIRGTDIGIWRRIRIIPFTAVIPENKTDKNLTEKLKKELSGVLCWAVEGYALYKREGFSAPAVVQRAVNEYRSEMDVISAFLSDCCTLGAGAEQSSTLYAVYCKWASDNNEYKMSHRKFTTELLKKDGVKSEHRCDGGYITGITLISNY